MTTKEILEMLNQQIGLHMLENFNGSSDPQFFKLSSVFTNAIKDVIEKLED